MLLHYPLPVLHSIKILGSIEYWLGGHMIKNTHDLHLDVYVLWKKLTDVQVSAVCVNFAANKNS